MSVEPTIRLSHFLGLSHCRQTGGAATAPPAAGQLCLGNRRRWKMGARMENRGARTVLDRVVDGKAVERWEQWDQMAMLKQLGLAQV